MGAENLMLKMATERDMGAEEWINYIVEKLKEWLIEIENFGESLIKKVEEYLSPEARRAQLKHWLIAAAIFIAGAVVLITCLRCCCRCCCRGRGRAPRMMRAPGRYPSRMPRDVFEGNPRSYFRNLRANTSIDELV
ncbi:hypothetical protein RHGRI_027108 [Rhododendron griersonianum]|uniref:Uncharacterized protein n=1 Tax=Rhododendron griersonianum TaxID=479676 RepID=A0AAV6J1S1_9ERIC|nr:hypothetical protein RHGRI_027108 [Rhododendron griersonianum]